MASTTTNTVCFKLSLVNQSSISSQPEIKTKKKTEVTKELYFETSKDALKAFNAWLLKANSHIKEQSIEISKNLKSVWKLIKISKSYLPQNSMQIVWKTIISHPFLSDERE